MSNLDGGDSCTFDSVDRSCSVPSHVLSSSSLSSSSYTSSVSDAGGCDASHPQSQPDEEAFVGWHDAPVLVTVHPAVPGKCLDADGLGRVQVNTGRPIRISSPSFEGQAVIYIKGLPSSPPNLFEGSKRKSMIAVQGRFQQEFPLDQLFTGQDFRRPARNLPPAWLVNSVLLRVARALCPSMLLGPMSSPYVLMPVVAGAQVLNVALPGAQPDITAPPVEDVRLMEPALTAADGGPAPAATRKRYFSSKSARQGRVFNTEHVYTFYLYQHLVDISEYDLHMVKRFDLSRHLDGQPMSFMLKHVLQPDTSAAGQYLFNFQIWHQKLLQRSAQQLPPTGTNSR